MTNSRLSELAAFVARQMEQRGWGLRAAERETGVSKTALKNILDNADVVPEMDTLVKLANAFGVPLWRIVEMCGFDLGLPTTPTDRAQRLAALVAAMPEYQPIVDQLLTLTPEDLEGVLLYLEAIRLRRQRQRPS